jgi:hypothetical protein
VRRSWIAGLALATAACGTTTGVDNCSPCAGPMLTMRGVPDRVGQVAVSVCVADEPCTSSREAVRKGIPTSLSVPLSTGARWEHYDGTTVTVTARSHLGRWHGSGSFEYTPDDGGTCSCAALLTQVRLEPITPRGSLR